jgi:FkbM family methyltransferase
MAGVRAGAYVMGVLPDYLGQFRLAQQYWWRRRPEHQVLSQRLVDGTRMELDLGDRTQGLAYLTRRYSEDLIRQIVSRLPPGGLFFDVGANVGLVTFQVAHRRPDVRIVAFEPNPAAVEAWRRNRRRSTSHFVALEAAAVTAQVGVVNLEAPSMDLGAGLVTPKSTGLEVPTTTLDAYCASQGIDRIDVVKVDVEGSEPDVLDGTRGLLTAGAIRSLIIEFNEDHLARRGTSRHAMVAWLADHLMVPSSPLDAGDVAFARTG